MELLDVLQTPGFIKDWRFQPLLGSNFRWINFGSIDAKVGTELTVELTDPGIVLLPIGNLVHLVLELFQTCNTVG